MCDSFCAYAGRDSSVGIWARVIRKREKKKKEWRKKKRRERSAKHWILEGALFFHFSPPLSLSLLSLLLAPFRATATFWQTGRYVPVRSALTSPFLSNLICRERRCESNFSPRRILDNLPSTIHPVCLLYIPNRNIPVSNILSMTRDIRYRSIVFYHSSLNYSNFSSSYLLIIFIVPVRVKFRGKRRKGSRIASLLDILDGKMPRLESRVVILRTGGEGLNGSREGSG